MSARALGSALALAFALVLPVAAQDAAPGAVVERLELRDATVADVARLVGEASDLNLVVTPAAAAKRVTLVLRRLGIRAALEALCKVSGLWLREDQGVIRIMTAEEYQADLVVQREPRTRVFTLLQPNGAAVGQAIRDLFGARVRLSFGVSDQLRQDAALLGLDPAGTGQRGSGSGARQFSTAVPGGITSTLLGGQTNGPGGVNGADGAAGVDGQGGGNGPETSERLAPSLTPEQLSHLDVDANRATGELEGLTEGRPTIAVTVSRSHNLVVVRTADADALAEVAALVLELDRATPQVLLEVKILELQLDDGLHTAVDVDLVDGPARAPLADGQPANPLVAAAGTAFESLLGAGNFPVTGGALVYQFLNDHVRARLQALGTEGRLSVLATPLLLCANNEPARVFIGEERPLVRGFQVQTVTTNGVVQSQLVPTVDLRDIGNSLRIVPRINADRTVILTIVQDVSSVNVGGASLPVAGGQGGVTTIAVDTVNTANLEGTVVARDGLTMAVGGLIRKELSDHRSGIPYLMDLPLIGWLFGRTDRVEQRRELVLLVTPHVLMTPVEAEERSRARMAELSLHPFHDLGDAALNRYHLGDVPGAADYRLLVEDWLLPAPQPIR